MPQARVSLQCCGTQNGGETQGPLQTGGNRPLAEPIQSNKFCVSKLCCWKTESEGQRTASGRGAANQKPHCSGQAAEPARTRKVPRLHSHLYLHSACLSDKPWIMTRNHHSLSQVVITAVVVNVLSLPENMLRLPVPCCGYRLGKGLFLQTVLQAHKSASAHLCCPTRWRSTPPGPR